MIYRGRTYLFDDYYVRVLSVRPFARGHQVLLERIGLPRVHTAGYIDFIAHAQLQPQFGENDVLPQPDPVPV